MTVRGLVKCATEATLASLDCRLGVAIRALTAAPSFGKPQKAIDKKLGKAQSFVRRAASATKAKKAKAALKGARKQLSGARKLLGGKKVPEGVRAQLLDVVDTLLADVAAVQPLPASS